jgi:hypothetical protein
VAGPRPHRQHGAAVLPRAGRRRDCGPALPQGHRGGHVSCVRCDARRALAAAGGPHTAAACPRRRGRRGRGVRLDRRARAMGPHPSPRASRSPSTPPRRPPASSTAHGHDRLSAVVQREVVAWRTHLTAPPAAGGHGLAPATVNTHLASLSGFTTWVCTHDSAALPHGNPCAKVGDLALPPFEPRALAPGQVRTLKNVLDRPPRFHQHKGRRRLGTGEMHGHARPLRDRAIVHTLLGTGLRREELVNLDLDQATPNSPGARRRRRRSAASRQGWHQPHCVPRRRRPHRTGGLPGSGTPVDVDRTVPVCRLDRLPAPRRSALAALDQPDL